ncbi:MAG: hypothetical protein RMM98_10065 [Acidobacteriota bacterium]|nr:hypothetical protein [Blastocatellia bacterium]MDW8239949.1 hypothetical protein [Acidobacteriota bacterium]
MNKGKAKSRDYKVGDEVSYALAAGIRYGTVVSVFGEVVEIEFEDGRKEMKKVSDDRLRLLRRAQSERDDRDRHRQDIRELYRSEVRRR